MISFIKEEHIYIHAANNSIVIIIESHEHGYEYNTAPNPTEYNHALNSSQEPLYRQPPSSHWYESGPYRIMQHPRPTHQLRFTLIDTTRLTLSPPPVPSAPRPNSFRTGRHWPRPLPNHYKRNRRPAYILPGCMVEIDIVEYLSKYLLIVIA